MENTLLEYKCPCCGGAISFDANLQKLKCPYCDTEFETEALKSYDAELQQDRPEEELKWNTEMGGTWQEGEEEGLQVFTCKSCGGELVTDGNTAATSCPYCDNPVVLTGRLSGNLKPDFVIPFKYDKKAAKEGLLNHFKGKKLLPKVFKDENHIDEIKGIYVPFWLFDAEANANIRYRGTRLRTWMDSNYIYHETQHYAIARAGSLAFERVPVDGSSKMEDALMESIEPYDFSDAMDFQTAFLAGYLADKYDVTADDSIARANERIKRSTEQTFESTVHGYSTLRTEYSNIRLNNGQAKYALYPVWILNTTWRDQKYTFAMNGQTGKFVGDLPLDKGALFKWLFGLTGILSAVGFGILSLVHYFL